MELKLTYHDVFQIWSIPKILRLTLNPNVLYIIVHHFSICLCQINLPDCKNGGTYITIRTPSYRPLHTDPQIVGQNMVFFLEIQEVNIGKPRKNDFQQKSQKFSLVSFWKLLSEFSENTRKNLRLVRKF